MALAVSPTLAELRLSVETRVNMGRQIRNSTALHPIVDEYIRQAFNLLINEANWIIMEVGESIDLIMGQHSYDLPDNIDVGDIREITVENIYNRELPLVPGVAYYERNAYRVDRNLQAAPTAEELEAQSGLPLRWEVIDQLLHIYPAPKTTEYPTLLVRGKAKPREPYSDGDRSFIDKEAHVLAATVAIKKHYKMEGADNDSAVLQRHLMNIRAQESDGESVQIGPERSHRYPEQNTRLDNSDRVLFWPDFDPFAPVNNRGAW